MKVDGDFVGFAFAGQNVSSGSSSRNKNPELSRWIFSNKMNEVMCFWPDMTCFCPF